MTKFYFSNTIMQDLQKIIDLIEISIQTEPNNTITNGNIIKTWYDQKVDEYRSLVENAHDWLNNYTQNLIENTGISTLKIKYTSAWWYCIEVPLSQKTKIPDFFIHKTTLVNALRFTTQELQEFEEKVTNAESLLYQREYEIFQEISSQIFSSSQAIRQSAQQIATLDCMSNFAQIAIENRYIKPEIHDGYDLEIIWGRHPVIEKIEKNFIHNELFFTKKNFVHIITWPNMWGKSTYLRQNALIILMAHTWSFVPATSAKIPLTDKIFSRVGASDNLFLWSSTFMVEMQEVANILNNSTSKSFVIIDEVGRGTSTYDGMSLAWAILRQNHDFIKAKTLFATHYHELVDESKKLPWVKNFSVAVSENDENIVFLRKIIPGSIKKSYGIEVAKLAWLPKNVIDEANTFLKNFENTHTFSQMSLGISPVVEEKVVYKEKTSEVEELLKNLDVNHLTPMQALNLLGELKGKV